MPPPRRGSVINARRFIWPPPRLNQNDRPGSYHIELAPYVRRFTNKEPWNVRVQWLACEGRDGAISVGLAVSPGCSPIPQKGTKNGQRTRSAQGPGTRNAQ